MRTAKKRRGRPKESKNKIDPQTQYNKLFSFDNAKIGEKLRIKLPYDYKISDGPKLHIATEPPSYLSRLEAATVKYETAINEAIAALKGK